MTFGRWIREHRTSQGVSLRQMASHCALEPSYVSKVERDIERASSRVALLFASQLRLDKDEALLRAGHIPLDIQELLRECPQRCQELRDKTSKGVA